MIFSDRGESIGECPVCGARRAKLLNSYTKDYLSRCRACAFVYSFRLPAPEEVNAVYENYTRVDDISTVSKRKNQELARWLLLLNPKARTCLDIACGQGYLLEEFIKEGITAYGTEHVSCKSVLVEKGIGYIEGGFFPETSQKFDLIIFTEAIEHINDPKDVVARVKEILNPGGLLYITTPNFNAIERFFLKSDWGMLAYPEHLTYYTPKTLSLLQRNAGLTEVYSCSMNISLFRIVQAINRRRIAEFGETSSGGGDPQAVSDKAQAMIQGSWFLSQLKRLANFALNTFGLGLSLVTVYRN